MAAKKAEPKKGGGEKAPVWVITFADMATLMFSFFILMLAFAQQDLAKFQMMLGSIQVAMGGAPPMEMKGAGAKVSQKFSFTVEKEEEKKTKEGKKIAGGLDTEKEGKYLEEVSSLLWGVQVVKASDGVRLRVPGIALFQPDSAELKGDVQKFLDRLAGTMKEKEYLYLTVEGHTDNVPFSSAQFPSNRDFSGFRASTVVRYLASKGVPENRMRAAGYGPGKPIADNATLEGRAVNGRVELLLQNMDWALPQMPGKIWLY